MYSRILKYPENKSFFLFGPRGSGKTSWVKATFPEGIYIDLLWAETYNDLLANPGLLEKFIPPNFDNWIIIDEVQKNPELLSEVHRLIEKYGYKFVLTGSSARKLRRKGVNLLGGRALTLHMHPLTSIELGNDFNLTHSLLYGHLPCAYTEPNPKDYLESYVKTYLQEEVQQEGLTRNLSAFSRFLEIASFSQAAVLNISHISRECSVDRKVAENYFSILEDILLANRLNVFTKKAKRRLVSHPKFYFFDVGVYRTLRPKGPLDSIEEAEGAAYETLFFQEIRAINDLLKCGYELYYWRTSNGVEVDFVLYGERGIRIFEVKRTNRIRKETLSGIKAFLTEYPMAKAYLVYGGEKRVWEENIEIIPIGECLKELPKILE